MKVMIFKGNIKIYFKNDFSIKIFKGWRTRHKKDKIISLTKILKKLHAL